MGTKKGNIPWNKGLKGKQHHSEELKKRFAELRKIPIKRICKICQKEFLGGHAALYCSKDCRPKRIYPRKTNRTYSRKINGTITNKWKEWQEKRVEAIERDKGTCQICKKFIGNSIDVHHIDEKGYCNSEIPNNELNNLICLCHRCHLFISSCLWHKKYHSEQWEKIKELIM